MKFEKPNLQTIFIVGGAVLLWFISSKGLDMSGLLILLSSIFLAFPLILLSIFIVPSIRKSIKNHYKIRRKEINKEIIKLRKEQDKITDLKELIDIDQEIGQIRLGLLGVKSTRFERCIAGTLILFTLTISVFYLDLGILIDTSNNILSTVFFVWGLYYLTEMLKTIFSTFEK